VIRHRKVDTSSPEGPGFNFLDADLNEALRKIQDRPAQFPKRHCATDGRVLLGGVMWAIVRVIGWLAAIRADVM
jgi:hypothetical protein